MLVILVYIPRVSNKIKCQFNLIILKQMLKGLGKIHTLESSIKYGHGNGFPMKSLALHFVKAQLLELRRRCGRNGRRTLFFQFPDPPTQEFFARSHHLHTGNKRQRLHSIHAVGPDLHQKTIHPARRKKSPGSGIFHLGDVGRIDRQIVFDDINVLFCSPLHRLV